MENKENENESKEISTTENNIKIPIYLNEEKYIINIYPSKNNINIIFKLEKEKIITYYFFAKFDLKDFHQLNKVFLIDKNINDIFISLKLLCKSYIINLQPTNKEYKMFLVLQNLENKKIKFTLNKKIVSQEKINPILEEQIEDNKIKLNILRNQIIKMDKISLLKNDIINKIKSTLSNINNKLNIISTINLNNLNLSNSTSSTKNSSSIDTISNPENNSNNINNMEDDSNDEKEKEKEKNKNNNTSNKKEKEKEKDDNKNKDNKNDKDKDNSLFCYDNSQNKKIIEFLIILNVVTILIVLYILGSNYNLRINFQLEPQYYESDNERLSYLSYMDNSRNNDNFRDIFQENLDMQKNIDEGGITNSKIKNEYIENKKKKLQERILFNYYDY